MRRHEWQFQWRVGELLEASKAKLEHHLARHAFYAEEEKKAKAALGATGIKIEEVPTSGSYQAPPNVSFNADLLRTYQRAFAKKQEHRAKIKEYLGWTTVFARIGSPNDTLLLHADDVLYFSMDSEVKTLQDA